MHLNIKRYTKNTVKKDVDQCNAKDRCKIKGGNNQCFRKDPFKHKKHSFGVALIGISSAILRWQLYNCFYY